MRQHLVQIMCGLIGIVMQAISPHAWAEPNEVEPHYYFELTFPTLPPPKPPFFDSAQAAYDFYKPGAQAELIEDAGPNGHPDILQDIFPSPEGGTINGFSTYYAVHVLHFENTPNGYAYVQHTYGAGIKLKAECPKYAQSKSLTLGNYSYSLACFIPEIPHPTCPAVGNPLYAATGRKQQTEQDYLSAGTSNLSFSRIYRSDANGWTHNQHLVGLDMNSPDLVLKPEYPPYLCYQGRGDTTNLPYCFPYKRKNTPNDFLLRRPDGRLIHFGTPNSLDPAADVNDRVVAIKNQNNQVIGWRVTNTSNHTQEQYDTLGRLLSSTNALGQTQTYTYSDIQTPANLAPKPGLLLSVTDWQGRQLNLSYDPKSRLRQLTDPAASLTNYAYDEPSAVVIGTTPPGSNLTSVTYPDGSQRLYHYNEPANTANTNQPNALTGITDENGIRLADYKYNSSGKALSTEHAGSTNKYSVSYLNPQVQSEVTNPLGSKTAYKFQTILGVSKLLSQSQPAGAGCGSAASAIVYDTNANIASQVDFTNQRTCHAYDLSRNLESVRIEGLPGADACPANLASHLLLAPVPGSTVTQRKISTQWHPDWSLQTRRAQPNAITTWVYNGQPDPTAGNAIATCAPAQALLPDGKSIAVLCKQIEQATKDATGNSGFAASAAPGVAPRVWTYTYNERGQVLTTDGPRTDNGILDRTTYTYHPATTSDVMQGDLATVTNAAGHTTSYIKYDKHGHVLRSVDHYGMTTENTYHPRGWLLSSTVLPAGIAPDSEQAQTQGLASTFEYDATGQMIKARTPNGSTVTYSYDAAQRLTGVTDNAGNSITYTLDAMGNRLQEHSKDPNAVLARQVNRVIDALNRVQQTVGAAQ